MRRKIRESFAKGPGPFIKGWPIPISTTDSCLFLPAIYCFKLGWFRTQRFYTKTQTYTQTTFPAKVVRKMMMPGYDRESKNDGRESTAKGFAKEVYEYNEMDIRFWTLLNWKTSWSLISRRCQMRTQRAIFVDFRTENGRSQNSRRLFLNIARRPRTTQSDLVFFNLSRASCMFGRNDIKWLTFMCAGADLSIPTCSSE